MPSPGAKSRITRAWLVLAVVAGCGRVDFGAIEAATDAASSDATSSDGAPSGIVNIGNTVQSGNGGTAGGVSLDVAPTRSGDLLVIVAGWCCGATVPTIADGVDSWQLAGAPTQDGHGDFVAILYAANAGVVTTVTFGAEEEFEVAAFSEYANVSSGVVDAYVGQTQTGTTGDSGPLTPGQPGELIVATGNDDMDAAPATAGPGFSLISPGFGTTPDEGTCSLAISCQGLAGEYRVAATTAAVDATFEWQVSYELPVVAAAFR